MDSAKSGTSVVALDSVSVRVEPVRVVVAEAVPDSVLDPRVANICTNEVVAVPLAVYVIESTPVEEPAGPMVKVDDVDESIIVNGAMSFLETEYDELAVFAVTDLGAVPKAYEVLLYSLRKNPRLSE
jgi:hypothetical protein